VKKMLQHFDKISTEAPRLFGTAPRFLPVFRCQTSCQAIAAEMTSMRVVGFSMAPTEGVAATGTGARVGLREATRHGKVKTKQFCAFVEAKQANMTACGRSELLCSSCLFASCMF